jgi:hypothetical protein
LATFGFACSPHDDEYEQNDTFTSATPLAIESRLEAIAVQDNPDYFRIDVPAGKRLVFRLENGNAGDSNGTDLRQVFGPDHEEIKARVAHLTRDCEELVVPRTRAGSYYIRIEERGEVDNQFPYSWPYKLSARIEDARELSAEIPITEAPTNLTTR